MALNIVYGIGGYCVECDASHDHPLHNVLEQTEIPDEETNTFSPPVVE